LAQALDNKYVRVPPNCVFEIDDFELSWNFSQPFEFIHARSIEGSVKDFPRLFRQAHKNLAPSGWFEVMEPTVDIFSDDDSVSKAPNLSEWRDMLIEASAQFGKPMGSAKYYKKWMLDVGFTDVREEIYKVGDCLMAGVIGDVNMSRCLFLHGQKMPD
jgi:trans-aconitate methyltransferase